jgi:hypothetical protein
MEWSTKSAIEYCLVDLSLASVFPSSAIGSVSDVPEKKKSVVLKLSDRLEIGIPMSRHKTVTCYIPAKSVDGRALPNDVSSIHPELVLLHRYSAKDGESIAGSILRSAPSLHPSMAPARVDARSRQSFIDLMSWLLARSP